jgi:hypothetical protein
MNQQPPDRLLRSFERYLRATNRSERTVGNYPGKPASRANVRHPAAAQLPTAQPFVLDGLPGTTPRRPRSVAGCGRAFGACCFAGKLRSSAGASPVPRWPRSLTPTSFPTSCPTRRGGVPLVSLTEHIGAGEPPWGSGAAAPSGGLGSPLGDFAVCGVFLCRWPNGVVPLAVELVPREQHCCQLPVAHLDPRGGGRGPARRRHDAASAGRRGNQQPALPLGQVRRDHHERRR